MARAPTVNAESFLYFAAVVDAGSFARAARRFGVDRSNVSRRIRNLESDLGVELIRRSTRRMQLTPLGQAFYERCALIGTEVEDAKKLLKDMHASVRGPVHVSCPPALSRLYLASLLNEFCKTHPDVPLRITLRNDVVDLIGEGVDVAVRLTSDPGSTTVARALADVEWRFCASPKYLRVNGIPSVPEDLANHAWLGLRPRMALEFARESAHRRVTVASRVACQDHLFLKDAVLAGLGIGLLPSYVVDTELRQGALKSLLQSYRLSPPPSGKIYAITLASRYMPPQVRALLDFLKAKFSPHPPWRLRG